MLAGHFVCRGKLFASCRNVHGGIKRSYGHDSELVSSSVPLNMSRCSNLIRAEKKDVTTVNKTPISTAMNDALYQYLMLHTRESELLQRLRLETSELQGAHMQISPEQGQFMAMLVHLLGAKKYLEIGVFTGYSLVATTSALPTDGKAVALDRDAKSMDIARRYTEEAGMSERVDFKLGPALDTLQVVADEYGPTSFDMAFIDADKTTYDAYFEFLLQLVRPGGLILIDNVLWFGQVADASVNDAATVALRDLNSRLLKDPRIDFSIVPIGDGVGMCHIRG